MATRGAIRRPDRRGPIPRPAALLRQPVIRHGESVKTVQARLGHASAAEPLDTYSHLWADSDDRTRQAVDDVLRLPHLADSTRTSQGGDA